MFYCREKELGELNKRYAKGNLECAVIYGRRRIGKTALIREFCKDKPTIFFSALEATARGNLEALSEAMYEFVDQDSNGTSPVYQDLQSALKQIFIWAVPKQLVFVIDEYPYLAKAEPAVSSMLQHLLDKGEGSRLFLILCGSSMSFMEKQVLGVASPLFGRRTCQLKIESLTYLETAVFNPNLDMAANALVYGITGGVPHYINKLSPAEGLKKALLDNVFNTGAYLFEEPQNLLKQELREPGIYNSLIRVIAEGSSRLNEIATKLNLPTGTVVGYLETLMELGIVQKELPFGITAGRKSIYKVADKFYRFWYRFVAENWGIIAAGRMEQLYQRRVEAYLSDYMGLIFEDMVREYLLYYADFTDFVPAAMGRWWGTDALTRQQVEIDLVVEDALSAKNMFVSCKYRNEAVGMEELALLQRYAKVYSKEVNPVYCIFSKSGFTAALQEREDVFLFTLEDMYRVRRK